MGTNIIKCYSPLWTPQYISPDLWFDASDSSTVILNSGVAEWRDKSGNNRHLAQGTSSQRPLITETLNNQPVISFTRSNRHFLQNTLFPISGWSNLLVFILVKWVTSGNSIPDIQCLIDNNHFGTPPRGFVIQDRPDLINKPVTVASLTSGMSDINGARDTITTGNDTWQMLGLYSSSAFDRLYRNGNFISSITRSNGAFNYQNILNVGRWGGEGGSRYINGSIAEIVITKNTDTIDKIFGYFAHKWGLTANLPINHPYKNIPPYV